MKKNVSFYVATKRIDKRGLAPIYGQVTIKSKNFPFQIEKVKPRYWNQTKQQVNKNREHEPDNRFQEINALIENLKLNTDRFERFESYTTPPPRDEVKKIFFQITPKQKNFNEAYNEFIETNKGRVRDNTTRNRNTAKNFISRYEKYIKIPIQFSDINIDFFESLYDYAMDIEELENNTFAAYIAKFKSFLKWANKKEYFSSAIYRDYSFTEKEKTAICLTKEEFEILLNYDFGNDRLNKTRDLYCFGCLTGLRFSDIKTLKKEHIQGDYIVKNITKTAEVDRIPILPETREIIEKYETNSVLPLPKLSNVKLNEYIKECCRVAGLNTPTIKYKYRRSEVIQEVHPKHDLITIHTARKTFISVSIDKGMDPFYVKRITGHKKESTFDKYVKLNDNKLKDELEKAWENDKKSIKINFTAIIEKNDDGSYHGLVQEYPEITTHGKTVKEVTEKLPEALKLAFDTQREKTNKWLKNKKIIKRKIIING